MIEAGTTLAGRYRVVRHLGTGGMASVYLAEDKVLGREVAVKRVHASQDSESGRRIVREAQIGAALRHPSLVTVFDIVGDGDALLLVMEYVPGETLAEALRRGPLPVPRALAVLRAVADALDHAHSEGVVHRDVKPANVLVRDDGRVKLADLGVATSEDVTRITRTGGLLGTVAYMAPEQFEPGPVTPAADVYALASVAFEVLAGRRAFDAPTPLQLMGQIREAPRPDLAEVRAATPPAAGDALCRGLARQPDDRPATAGELVDALEAAFREDPEPDGGDDPTAVLAPVRDDPTLETPPRAEETAAHSWPDEAESAQPHDEAASPPLRDEHAFTPPGAEAASPPAREDFDSAPPRDEAASPPPRDEQAFAPAGDESASVLQPGEDESLAPAEDPTTEAPLVSPAPAREAASSPAREAASSPAREAASSPARRRSRLWPVAFGLLALALVAVAAVVLSSTGSDERSPERAETPPSTAPRGETQTDATPEEPAKPPRADATPESAVRAFYTRAADGDLDGAWNLAGPRMRAQFNGSRAEFADTLGSLRSIRFITLEETARTKQTATIRIETVAEHTTRTDRCTGTLQASRRGNGWRVEPAGVSCTQV